MEQLISSLKSLTEYKLLLQDVQNGRPAAVTGISQICRSHMIAGLYAHTDSPVVVVCQDDMSAKKMQEELQAFLGIDCPAMPGRELTLFDSAVVSRAWEQKRLRQLYDLMQGNTRLQILTWEALSQRTIPPQVLKSASFSIETGKEYSIDDLSQRLIASGYSRCSMVEGPGQFAVRGGILDIYLSPTDPYEQNSSVMSLTPWAILIQRPSEEQKMYSPLSFFPLVKRSPVFTPVEWMDFAVTCRK